MDDLFGDMDDEEFQEQSDSFAAAVSGHQTKRGLAPDDAINHVLGDLARRGMMPRDLGIEVGGPPPKKKKSSSNPLENLGLAMAAGWGDDEPGVPRQTGSTAGVLPHARLAVEKPPAPPAGAGAGKRKRRRSTSSMSEGERAHREVLRQAGLESTSCTSTSESESGSSGYSRRDPSAIALEMLTMGDDENDRPASPAAAEDADVDDNPEQLTYNVVLGDDDGDDDDDDPVPSAPGGGGGGAPPPGGRPPCSHSRSGPFSRRMLGSQYEPPAGLLPEKCFGCMWGDWSIDPIRAQDIAAFSNLVERYLFRIPREQLAHLMKEKYDRLCLKHPMLPPWSYDGVYTHLRIHMQSDPRVVIYEIIHEVLIPSIRDLQGMLFDETDDGRKTVNKTVATTLKDLLTQLKAWMSCDFTKMIGYNPGFALDIKSMSAAIQDPGYKARLENEEHVAPEAARFLEPDPPAPKRRRSTPPSSRPPSQPPSAPPTRPPSPPSRPMSCAEEARQGMPDFGDVPDFMAGLE